MVLKLKFSKIKNFFIKTTRELFEPPKKRVASLDGVRTLAILLVVGLHSSNHIIWAGLEKSKLATIPPFQGGWIGVPLFFILSGYFIGTQLWREFEKTGSVKVGTFILRRGLRVWPLYYFVLVSVLLIFPEYCKTIWSNVFFLSNYLGDEGPVRGAWSLSTEEQFYLFIPTFIFLTSTYGRLKTLKSYRYILLFALVLPSLSRAITWYILTGFDFFDISLYRHYIYHPIHTHFDGFVVGLLISNIMSDKSFTSPRWLSNYWSFLFFSTVVGLSLKLLNKVTFNYAALAIIFGAFVWMCLNKDNIVTKILSWTPFYWTAKVSFGVYLVHWPVLWTLKELGWFEQTIGTPELYLLMTYGVTFLISCIVSSLTYVLVEAPFILWRNSIL